MKYLLTLLFTLFALTANSQSISVGSDYAQIGASQNSVYAEATYTSNLIWKFNTKVSAGAGIVQSESDTFVQNGTTKRFNGHTESNANVAFMPSAMVGVDLPISKLSLGVYSGYRSEINANVKHRFVPISLSISFRQ